MSTPDPCGPTRKVEITGKMQFNPYYNHNFSKDKKSKNNTFNQKRSVPPRSQAEMVQQLRNKRSNNDFDIMLPPMQLAPRYDHKKNREMLQEALNKAKYKFKD